jgi:cobalt/nickel transport system permease protein
MSAALLHDHSHSRVDSPVHRLPAALKFFAALALMLTTVLLPRSQAIGLAVVAALLVVVVAASWLSVLFLLKRLLLLEPLVLGVAVLALFQPGGVRVFLVILAKTNLCLLTTIMLSGTTPFSEILRVLKRIRVPWLMVSTLALMHRYLFVLADEAERMRRARASRTFTGRRRFEWRTLATVAGQLFVRASERAERIYDAMCARGWK